MKALRDKVYIGWHPDFIGQFKFRGKLVREGLIEPTPGEDQFVKGVFFDEMRKVSNLTLIMPLFIAAIDVDVTAVTALDPEQREWLYPVKSEDGKFAGFEVEYPATPKPTLHAMPLEFFTDRGPQKKCLAFMNGVPGLWV